jgi:ATP-binding cassette subfamily B protein
VGRTGAGKTSLLNLLAGVYAPWDGTIAIDGIDPRSLRPEERRRLLGAVPQALHILEGSIRENLTLGDPAIHDDQVRHAAQVVGLHDLIQSLPQGYDTEIGSGGANLSHGQQQLLSLARALVCRPAVLLLDEPTSGLDADSERRLFAAIREQSQQRTTITVSHRLSGVMDADRVIVMSNGSIVQDGTPAALASEDGWYAMMSALETLGWRNEVLRAGSAG